MSDYSNALANYNYQISVKTDRIGELQREITQMNNQISDYEEKIQKINSMRNDVVQVASSGSNKINNIALSMSRAVLNANFFSGYNETVNGSRYQAAIGDFDRALNSLNQKIENCNSQIDSDYAEISRLNSQINSLENAKRNLIASATSEETA